MRNAAIWDYIYLGTGYRFLQDVRTGTPIKPDGYVLYNIARVLRSLDDLGLPVTKRAASDLIDFERKLKEASNDAKLTTEQAGQLKNIMNSLRLTFEAETTGQFVYLVTDKRLSLEKILNRVEGLFRAGVYATLPETAQHDFAEAGKLIAFERPTAAAFHLLRGTEDVIRVYYRRYMRKPPSGKTWGRMTQELRSKARGKRPDPGLAQQLDYIRTTYRNPTQHPDKIYDLDEAQDLFPLCVDVVNRMMVVVDPKGVLANASVKQ
ncbi:MAG: hypothetical protein MUP47_10720 [Phycisphaerae bacterium]|nr:hypothetical protein [Phycisphaerae bacterium]